MDRETLVQEAMMNIRLHRGVFLNWGTSVGKSRGAICMVNELMKNVKIRIKVLLLVAETAHKDNWKEEFNKWHLNPQVDVTIECYHSLHKYQDSRWNIIIADEAHHLQSERRMMLFQSMKSHRWIFLTATMPYDTQRALQNFIGDIYISRVNMQKSIEEGILAKPDVYLIPVTLDSVNQSEEIVEKRGMEPRVKARCSYMQRFMYPASRYPNLELHIRCTEKEKSDYLNAQITYWNERYATFQEDFAKNKLLRLGAERKSFLGSVKTKSAQKVIESRLKDKRSIIFCVNIAQANALGGKHAIHSKIKNPLAIVDKFNAGKTDKLFAVGMLQEGMNLKDIESGMIIQLDACQRGWIQKMGRMMRSQHPEIFILYCPDTRDDDFLKNILEGIDNSYIHKLNQNGH